MSLDSGIIENNYQEDFIMNRMKNLTKAKILLSSSFKTLIVQIAASLCGAFMPLPVAYCTSIVLCVVLGLWLLGECDFYAVISSFFSHSYQLGSLFLHQNNSYLYRIGGGKR